MNCPSCGHENIDGIDRCENCLAPFRQLDIPSADAAESFARSVMEDNLSRLDAEEPIFVSPLTPAIEVARRMKSANSGCALVLDGTKLVGIFTEHDVLLKMTPGSAGVSSANDKSVPSAVADGSHSQRSHISEKAEQVEPCEGTATILASEVTEQTALPVEQLPVTDMPFSDIPVEELRAEEAQFRETPVSEVQVNEIEIQESCVSETSARLQPPAKDLLTVPVKDLMSPNPETLHEKDSVAAALNKMSMGRYRHLPIRKSDGSYTVASIKSVLNYIAQEDW